MAKQKINKRPSDFNTELDAFADYYERYGVKPQALTPTERRKIIENWKEDHPCNS